MSLIPGFHSSAESRSSPPLELPTYNATSLVQSVSSPTGYLHREGDRSEDGEYKDVKNAEDFVEEWMRKRSRSAATRREIAKEIRTSSQEITSGDFYPLHVESTNSERASTKRRRATKGRRMKEARVSSQEITLDDLIGLQTSSGSFAITKTRFRSRLMRHFSHEVVSEMDQGIEKASHWTIMRRAEFQAIRDTILIVAFIKFHYPESAELWELIALKARDWVGRSLRDPDVLTELEKIARDNIDSESSAMPATGPSDVPTTPLEPARSTTNSGIVAEKADEDNFKEHTVENGVEIDSVVDAKSG